MAVMPFEMTVIGGHVVVVIGETKVEIEVIVMAVAVTESPSPAILIFKGLSEL